MDNSLKISLYIVKPMYALNLYIDRRLYLFYKNKSNRLFFGFNKQFMVSD